jgi:hypothetical protein
MDERLVAVLRQHRIDVTSLPPGSPTNAVEAAGITAGRARELDVALVLETPRPRWAVMSLADWLCSAGVMCARRSAMRARISSPVGGTT